MPLDLKTRLTFRIPGDLEYGLQHLANRARLPMAPYIRSVLWDLVDVAKADGRIPEPVKPNGKKPAAHARKK